MKIVSRYPALVYGTTKGMRKDRFILCAPEGEFEMVETTSADAPVAMTTHEKDESQDFRLFRGKFYTREEVGLVTTGTSESFMFSRHNRFFGHIMEQISEEIDPALSPDDTVPKDLKNALRSSRDDRINVAAVLAASEKLDRTRRVESDLERWKKLATGEFEGRILIDGELWVAVEEPCYALDTEKNRLYIADMRVYEKDYNMRHFWQDTAYRYFPADALEDVQDYRKRTGLPKDAEDDVYIGVVIPGCVSGPLNDREIRRVAEAFAWQAAKDIIQQSDMLKENPFRFLPMDFMMKLYDLRNALNQEEPREVFETLRSFLNSCEQNAEKIMRVFYGTFADRVPKILNTMLEEGGENRPKIQVNAP